MDDDAAPVYKGVAKMPPTAPVRDEPAYAPAPRPPRSRPLVWVLVFASLAVTPDELNLPSSLGDLVGFTAAEGTVNGKMATVPATVSVPVLGSTNFKVFLVDEEGAWKVCGLGPA